MSLNAGVTWRTTDNGAKYLILVDNNELFYDSYSDIYVGEVREMVSGYFEKHRYAITTPN